MSDQPLNEQTVGQFLDNLASGAPTPGGGSAAGVAGAMAAGLVAMVCNLSIGKKQYADFEDEARAILERAEQLRSDLQQLAQEDISAFDRLMAAYRLPRVTDADAATRRAAIQQTTRYATEVPIRTARAIADLLPLCAPLARSGNRTAASDVGAAALLIQAAVPIALLNVETNLPVIEDQQFVRESRAQIADLTVGLQEEISGVLMLVRDRLKS
jgi:formiminotetrahydrofolate cyclodeaminase